MLAIADNTKFGLEPSLFNDDNTINLASYLDHNDFDEFMVDEYEEIEKQEVSGDEEDGHNFEGRSTFQTGTYCIVNLIHYPLMNFTLQILN